MIPYLFKAVGIRLILMHDFVLIIEELFFYAVFSASSTRYALQIHTIKIAMNFFLTESYLEAVFLLFLSVSTKKLGNIERV